MRLLPALSAVASLAARAFYRLTVSGGRVPPADPVLLVANHPNSLLDPALVAAVAGRPVRFLAKAPLFSDPQVGWLVRASGAIPVFRAVDDPAAMGRNEDAFRAAQEALARGDAVGIFPEGISHSGPALVPLRTGAARIALGAARRTGNPFPIVPVGLTFRDRQRFRSEALAILGEAVSWADLAGRDDPEAVRELTRRIEMGLREVTVNLERWEDAPLTEWAEAIVSAEIPTDPRPERRIARLREASQRLAAMRREGDGAWMPLRREVARHGRVLRALGLRPHELHAAADAPVALRWLLRRLPLFVLGVPLALLGAITFGVPYRLTGAVSARARAAEDVRATHKLLGGAVIHLLWTLGLAGIVAAWRGPAAGVRVLVLLPILGAVTLLVWDRWRIAVGEAGRFGTRLRRRALLAELRARQGEIARRLEALRRESPV